jgi:hypothetical protein
MEIVNSLSRLYGKILKIKVENIKVENIKKTNNKK